MLGETSCNLYSLLTRCMRSLSTPLDWAHVLVLIMKVLPLKLVEMAGVCLEICAHLTVMERAFIYFEYLSLLRRCFNYPSVGLQCQRELFCTRRRPCVLCFLWLGCTKCWVRPGHAGHFLAGHVNKVTWTWRQEEFSKTTFFGLVGLKGPSPPLCRRLVGNRAAWSPAAPWQRLYPHPIS